MRILNLFFIVTSVFLVACTGSRRQEPREPATKVSSKASSKKSLAPLPAPTWDPTSWPHERKGALPADPAVTFGHLANGLAYAILENDEPKDNIAVRLLVRSGSLAEQGPVDSEKVKAVDEGRLDWPGDERGILHFLEHVSFSGGEYYDWTPELFEEGKTLVQQLQREGMGYGAHTNAHTHFHEIVYKFTAPRSDPKLFTMMMQGMRDFAGGLLIKPEAVEKERGIVLSEKRMSENARFNNAMAEIAFIFEGSRLASRLPIGSERVIREISPEGVWSLYKRLYRPDNLALVVVGKVDTAAVEKEIEDLFGDLKRPAQPLPKVDLGKAPYSDTYRVKFHRQTEHKDVSISISKTYPEVPRLDTLQQRKHELSLALASSMLSERFSQKVKEPGSPLLGLHVDNYENYFDLIRYSSLNISAAAQNWEAALAIGEQELRRALEHGFVKEEFERARASLLRAAQDAVSTAPTRDSSLLASSIVSSASLNRVFQSPQQILERVEAFLKEVTLERVVADFKSAWSAPQSWVFMVGDPDLPQGEEEAMITQAYRRSQKVAVKPWEDKPLVPWAYKEWGPAGEILKREYIEDLGVTQVEFANHVRVSLKPTDFEADQVLFRASVGSGFLELPGEDSSLTYLFDGAFIVGGLEAHGYDDLRRLFHDRRVGLSASVDLSSFEFGYTTAPRDLETQLQLFSAYLMAPGYRPESLSSFQRDQGIFYDNFYSDIYALLGARSREVLYNEDPRFAFPARESVLSLDLNDLRNWVQPSLRSGYLEVALVGEFQLEEAIALCAKTLGALPKRDELPARHEERRQVRFPNGRKPELIPVETKVASARVAVHLPGVDAWNQDISVGLSVLMEVLENRLIKVLRESLGVVYNVRVRTSSSSTFKNYGRLSIFTEVAPVNVEMVTNCIRNEMEQLAKEGVSHEELERAMNPVLSDLRRFERDNSFWANYVHGSFLLPEQLDWLRGLKKRHEDLTVEDLNSLATSYLDWSRSVVFWAEPELGNEDLVFASPKAAPEEEDTDEDAA